MTTNPLARVAELAAQNAKLQAALKQAQIHLIQGAYGYATMTVNDAVAALTGTGDDVLADRVGELKAAMQKFCDRVDRGEVRSVKTYAEFKALLAK